jgi:hypothetical protein
LGKQLTKEKRERLGLEQFVVNLGDAITARTHLHREWFVQRVLCPILYFVVFICVALLSLDALGIIPPMRSGLLIAITTILTSGVVSSGASAGFGWLFNREVPAAEEKVS